MTPRPSWTHYQKRNIKFVLDKTFPIFSDSARTKNPSLTGTDYFIPLSLKNPKVHTHYLYQAIHSKGAESVTEHIRKEHSSEFSFWLLYLKTNDSKNLINPHTV